MSQSDYSENMAVGFAGRVDFSYGKPEFVTMRNDNAADAMPFGYAVKYDDISGDRTSAGKTTAITDVIAGFVAHSHEYESTQLDATGVLPGHTINVLKKGRIQVLCEDAVKPGDRMYIRSVLAGAEVAGSPLPAADGADTIDSIGQGVFDSIAAAGGLAWLIVDFTNIMTNVN